MQYSITDVIKIVIGQIEPIGETYADEKRYNNLQQMEVLIENLIAEVGKTSLERDRYESSVKKIGEEATKFLKKINYSISGYLED